MRRFRAFLFVGLVLAPQPGWPQGTPIGPEFRVNTYTTGYQGNAAVARDGSGNFVVVWTSNAQDGSGYGIFGQRYDSSGAPLGPEFRVNTNTSGRQDYASVASDAAGNFVVVWHSASGDGSDFGVFSQRYDSSGAPLGGEFQVNSYTTGGQSFASVAMAPGGFVIAWTSVGQDGDGAGVFGQRYSSSGAPLGSEFRVNTFTTSDQLQPAVASDAAGNFVVVWESNLEDGYLAGIFGQRFASGGAPIGPEFRVNTHTTSYQRHASVSAGAAGDFVVVWQSRFQDGGGPPQPVFDYGVFGQRFSSSGAPLGPEFRANTYTTGTQALPAVASDAAGNFVVVWESRYQAGGVDVFGQRYDSSGTPQGPEFLVNSSQPADARTAAVAADPAGDFVAVWRGFDGSGNGVFGQRFSGIVPIELIRFSVE